MIRPAPHELPRHEGLAQPAARVASRIVLLCAMSYPVDLKAQTVTPPQTAYDRAQHAFDEKHFRDAADLFAAAAREQNAPADALLREAKSLIHAGDPAAADAVLRAHLTRDSRSAEALYLLGFVLQRENRPKESLETFTRAASIQTPHANDLKLVALDYVLLDDYPDAVRWLKRSLQLDPRNAEAWYDLGRADMHQGDFAEAERNFNRALALAPGSMKALNNLGLSLEAQNRTAEALSAYEHAIAAQNSDSMHASEQPLLNYGALLNSENRGSEALAPLLEAVRLAPRDSRCHEELARAYLQTHQEQPAITQFEQAVALDPANPRLHFQLGQLYRKRGDTARAAAELKASSSLYGSHSSVPEPK